MFFSHDAQQIPRVRGYAVLRPLGRPLHRPFDRPFAAGQACGPPGHGSGHGKGHGSAAPWLVRSETDAAYRILTAPALPGELRISALPDHPGLVRVTDRLAPAGHPSRRDDDAALVELAPGGSLTRLCEEGLRTVRLSGQERVPAVGEARAVSLLRDVVGVLRHLHRHRTPHGALGPDSVLFGADGRVMLRAAGALSGADARDDLRALGALAWYILAGSEPPEESLRPPVSSLFTVDRRLSSLIEEALSPAQARPPSLCRWARVLRRADRRLQKRGRRRRQDRPEGVTFPSDRTPETAQELATQRLPIISRGDDRQPLGTRARRRSARAERPPAMRQRRARPSG